MNTMSAFLVATALLIVNHNTIAQNPDSSLFIDVSYVKSNSENYAKFETEIWKPINKQMISEGKKSGWYLYKVKYPQGSKAEYDYVVVNVFHDWSQLTFSANDLPAVVKKINPSLSVETLLKNSSEKRTVVWRQLFRLLGQAVGKETTPSKYVIANEVKVVAGQESEYVKMEQTYFKPFHTARAAEGIMNNWGLYKREMPYGEKFPSDYVTFNGYATWEDITKQNPPTAWKTVHGNLNFSEIHDKILSKRVTVNVECWELVDYAVK
jgi:hypothetical protein